MTGGVVRPGGSMELVLEVLAARNRLGESEWTFTDRGSVRNALRALEEAALVTLRSHPVEKCVYARLTDAGRAEALGGSGYVSPLERERNLLSVQLKNARNKLASL